MLFRSSIMLYSLFITLSLFSLASSLTYPIVGTNQSTFYQDKAPCRTTPKSSSDSYYGQDAQYASLAPAYRNNGDGTITDLNTGLMWSSARGGKCTVMNCISGAKSFTLANYSDWRMPTIKELYSLIQYTGKSGATDAQCIPYIDTKYFEIVFGDATGYRVIDGQDYSSNIYVGKVMQGQAADFGTNFIDGRIKGYGVSLTDTTNSNGKYVRYVRGPTNYGINDFVVNGDNTITDRATGLMWAQYDSGFGMNWKDALAWVQQKNAQKYLGYSDWRLPTIKQLQSIVDYTRSPDTTNSAAISPLFNCSSIINEGGALDWPYFWSGTTHLDNMGGCYVAFGRALGYMKFGGNSYYTLADVHGAGAQRSDPKSGSPTSYPLGVDSKNNTIYGLGPQGDILRINNYVRMVRIA